MKVLVLDTYRVFYYLTGSKVLSYICAVISLSAMYVILLTGIVTLLQDMLPRAVAGLIGLPAEIAAGVALAVIIFVTTPLNFVAATAQHNQGRSLYRLLILAMICVLMLTFNYLVKHF
jgi:hypothetical protein